MKITFDEREIGFGFFGKILSLPDGFGVEARNRLKLEVDRFAAGVVGFGSRDIMNLLAVELIGDADFQIRKIHQNIEEGQGDIRHDGDHRGIAKQDKIEISDAAGFVAIAGTDTLLGSTDLIVF